MTATKLILSIQLVNMCLLTPPSPPPPPPQSTLEQGQTKQWDGGNNPLKDSPQSAAHGAGALQVPGSSGSPQAARARTQR